MQSAHSTQQGPPSEGNSMQQSQDQLVRLMQDIPELGLHTGEVGVVCSTWFAPTTAFEVEFETGLPFKTRALLLASQIQKHDA